MARFFDYTKEGKGIDKNVLPKKGIALYFDILLRRFWKMSFLNLLFLVTSIPAIVAMWTASTYLITWVAILSGVGVGIATGSMSFFRILLTFILLLFCGSGPASASVFYILRKYVHDTHSWVWSDFFNNIKSNFKQGLCAFIINLLVVFILLISLVCYHFFIDETVAAVLKIMVWMILIIFLMMQMYVYQMMSGFELNLKHIYKNAFLLTMLSPFRSVFAIFLTTIILFIIYLMSSFMPVLGMIAFFLITFTLIYFTLIFATDSVVKKYMFGPLNRENSNPDDILDCEFE